MVASKWAQLQVVIYGLISVGALLGGKPFCKKENCTASFSLKAVATYEVRKGKYHMPLPAVVGSPLSVTTLADKTWLTNVTTTKYYFKMFTQ